MSDQLVDALRCPLDPLRETTLHREQQALQCDQCAVTFPIRNGIPVLVPDSANLPEGVREISQLRCQRRENRRINRDSIS